MERDQDRALALSSGLCLVLYLGLFDLRSPCNEGGEEGEEQEAGDNQLADQGNERQKGGEPLSGREGLDI